MSDPLYYTPARETHPKMLLEYGKSKSHSIDGSFDSESQRSESPPDPFKYLGIIPSLQHSPTQSPSSKTIPYRSQSTFNYPLTFADSGLGGLLFMLDAVREINPDLRAL